MFSSKGLAATIGKVTGFIKELDDGIAASTTELLALEAKAEVLEEDITVATNIVVGLSKIVKGEE